MVGEAYGWVNSHRSLWVGLFLAEEQLLPTFAPWPHFFVIDRSKACVVWCSVHRSSLTPMTSTCSRNGLSVVIGELLGAVDGLRHLSLLLLPRAGHHLRVK